MELFAQEPAADAPKPLNGMYYEQSSRKFVSFVLGRRYWERLASLCRPPMYSKEWQEKIKRERAIP
ncbi:hypothetical protein DUZ99_02195 [Xylanibacillus composti]|nr:hypothetical protein [Xylanibacillus composti]